MKLVSQIAGGTNEEWKLRSSKQLQYRIYLAWW